MLKQQKGKKLELKRKNKISYLSRKVLKRKFNNLKIFLSKEDLVLVGAKRFLNLSDMILRRFYVNSYFVGLNKKVKKDFFFVGRSFSFEIFKQIKKFKSLLFGVGLKRLFKYFVVSFGVNYNYVFKDGIDRKFLYKLQTFVMSSKVNLNLKREINYNRLFKKRLNTYQAIRYKNNLPIRGQRSYANGGSAKRLNVLK